MADAYMDTMTTLSWFAAALIVVTLLGLFLMAVVRHVEAVYLATLMEQKERRRK